MWSFFSSLRLAVVLLVIIVLVSIAGTLIPQQEAAHHLLHRLPRWLGSVFVFLELYNLFRSPWFITLLGLFSLNLLICSWNRIPVAWRLYRRSSVQEHSSIFNDLPDDHKHTSNKPITSEAQRIEGLLRKKRYQRVERKETDEGIIISGSKGSISYLGPYIIHLGILIIILGAVIGILFGFKAYVNILEGETITSAQLLGRGGVKPLGFSVRCDKFTVEFYESGQPKMFRSDLTFLRDNKPFHQGALLVNHPIELEGIRFYQSSYGSIPDYAHIGVMKDNIELSTAKIPLEGQVELSAQGLEIKVIRLRGNLMGLGPAAKIQVTAGKQVMDLWLFKNLEEIKKAQPGFLQMSPMFNPEALAPYTFTLKTLDETYYTGLQVNRDPGAPVVAIGAIFMMYGLIVAFYYSHRLVYVLLREEQGVTLIAASGKSNKDPVIMERELNRLLKEIKT